MQPTPAPYPVDFQFRPPEKIARWRPLVHWFLAIPHFIVLWVYGLVAGVVAIIAWFSGVFTAKVPEGLANLLAGYVRYNARVGTYVLFLREEYPSFSWNAHLADPGDDPHVLVSVTPELDGRNRLTIFFRYFMLIPHALFLLVLGIAVYVVLIIGFFAVLFTGRWPEGLHDFVIKVMRLGIRVNGYGSLLTDQFPPFSLD